MGIDPVTHKPLSDALGTGGGGGPGAAQHAEAAAHPQPHGAVGEREASRVRALSDTPPTSMLSYSESATHASVLEEFLAACAAACAPMPQPTQAARKDHLRQQQWEDQSVNADDADCTAAHGLDSPPTSMLSYSESATHASVMEEFLAACAAACAPMPQPTQSEAAAEASSSTSVATPAPDA